MFEGVVSEDFVVDFAAVWVVIGYGLLFLREGHFIGTAITVDLVRDSGTAAPSITQLSYVVPFAELHGEGHTRFTVGMVGN